MQICFYRDAKSSKIKQCWKDTQKRVFNSLGGKGDTQFIALLDGYIHETKMKEYSPPV